MTKTLIKTPLATAAAEVLDIPEVFRVVLMNFAGGAGKTTIARHVFMPVLPGAELIRVETINSSGASAADVEVTGKQFEDVAKMLYAAIRHTLVDVGASNIELVKQVLYRVAGAHRFVDMWVVPCIPDKKMIADTISTLKELLKIGVPPKNIVVLKNKVNDVDKMDADFEELTAVATVLRVRLIDRPLLEFELYGDMLHRQGSLDDVLADTTDYRAAMLAARKAGDLKAAEDAMHADFRRMNAGSAVANIENLRRDIFGTVPAPVAAVA